MKVVTYDFYIEVFEKINPGYIKQHKLEFQAHGWTESGVSK